MDIDDRKRKILEAIVRNYLETGEPVGSRTISKYTDLNLSSATIRNEMSDLEELGYILQPYTSAGRIPSDKGYRFYVDSLMEDKVREVDTMKEMLIEKADKIELLLQQVAKLLAVNTNYATMVTGPQYKNQKIKFIQLSEVGESQLLVVIVLEGNVVKNEFISLSEEITREAVLRMNIILNSYLQGMNVHEISLAAIHNIKTQSGEYANLIGEVLEVIGKTLSEDEGLAVYTSGATNILKYPELSDNDRATELLYTLEEKKQLTNLIANRIEDEESRGIQVYIGNETPVKSMQDCSVVTATYEVEEGVYGKVGIIGPKRMDYEKVVHTLQSLMAQLDDIFKNKT